MNEIRVRVRVMKKQNKIVPEIRQTWQCFRYIYAIIAIKHVFVRALTFAGSLGRF